MQRVIVTGGLGFIGSHVADAFLARGDEVVIIDSMVAAVTDGYEYEEHPRCTVIRKPVEDYLAEGGDFAGYATVVHAASHVGPAGILKYQGRLGIEIVTTTQAVIDASLAGDCQLVVFSSAEVYGRSGQLAETDSIVVPTNYNARLEYAIGKTLTEAAAINTRVHGLEAIVVRPFNVAGARQSSAGGFVMPTFVQQALAGDPITVFAGGDQVRAFLAASDLARFMVENLDDAFAGGDTIFNLGNPGNATTIWNLAARTKELVDSSSEIIHADAEAIHGPLYVEAESFEKLPVLSAAAKVGWKPRASLDQLILETAAEYREHGDARVERTASLS
ncbi:MAG: NAD-dependent epimerase/dehydratase family protein [Thermoleophilaceae bacterium]